MVSDNLKREIDKAYRFQLSIYFIFSRQPRMAASVLISLIETYFLIQEVKGMEESIEESVRFLEQYQRPN